MQRAGCSLGHQQEGGEGCNGVAGIYALVSARREVSWRGQVGVHHATPALASWSWRQVNVHLKAVCIEGGIQVAYTLAPTGMAASSVSVAEADMTRIAARHPLEQMTKLMLWIACLAAGIIEDHAYWLLTVTLPSSTANYSCRRHYAGWQTAVK